MFYVYILQSLKDRKYYIGYTSNLDQRISQHNQGKTRSLRGREPFKLIYKEIHSDRSSAIKREKEIKRYKGGNAFHKLIGPIV